MAKVAIPLPFVVPAAENEFGPVTVTGAPDSGVPFWVTVTWIEPTGSARLTLVVEPEVTVTPVCWALPAPRTAVTV